MKQILLSVHQIKGLKASSDAFSDVKDGLLSQLMSNDVDTSRIRSIVEGGMQLSLGNGNSIKFWHDFWCDVGPLKTAFHRLFAISL